LRLLSRKRGAREERALHPSYEHTLRYGPQSPPSPYRPCLVLASAERSSFIASALFCVTLRHDARLAFCHCLVGPADSSRRRSDRTHRSRKCRYDLERAFKRHLVAVDRAQCWPGFPLDRTGPWLPGAESLLRSAPLLVPLQHLENATARRAPCREVIADFLDTRVARVPCRRPSPSAPSSLAHLHSSTRHSTSTVISFRRLSAKNWTRKS